MQRCGKEQGREQIDSSQSSKRFVVRIPQAREDAWPIVAKNRQRLVQLFHKRKAKVYSVLAQACSHVQDMTVWISMDRERRRLPQSTKAQKSRLDSRV